MEAASLLTLPGPLLERILLLLDDISLCQLAASCAGLRNAALAPALWRGKCDGFEDTLWPVWLSAEASGCFKSARYSYLAPVTHR